MPPHMSGHVDFSPDTDIPSLRNKVILVTGGTAGLGKASIEALAKHEPAHIYFTGRNATAAQSLISSITQSNPSVALTFLEMDMGSLSTVKAALKRFAHDRLDILMCNAGIMASPAGLSKDGFEIQFAINHLGNAMVIQQLLPILKKTAEEPGSDIWVAAAAKRDELVNGAFYMPVGVESNSMLDKTAKDDELARKLWEWTDEVLAKF
ncbi:hypothetical protein SLS62_000536 [Diatrype stigma]|uniref:Protochlorophyllide reductase n=1 Tax=Diatrype stigma TaxID=117547 RepID=A0AAN9YUJ5_9PEZI